MTSSVPSSLPIEDNPEESQTNLEITEQQISLRNRNKSQIILARKLRNLQEFATAYDLNLSNDDDRLLQTDTARVNVQRMANDLITSIEETNKMNLGSLVGVNNRRLLTQSRIEIFYQELLDVMPLKWKEIFQHRQGQTI
jgi:hypothetical protein